MTRRFRVKVGDKVFVIEVEEILGEPKAVAAPPAVAPPLSQVTQPVPSAVEPEAPGVIRAPLPGNVLSIKCQEGDEVRQGDPLLVLESMKMENTILASKTGVVRRITVTEKAPVNYGDTLVIIE